MARTAGVPSNQTRGFRLIQSDAILRDNQQINIDLPRGPHIESCALRIGGTFTVTDAWDAARALAPYRFLKRADWMLNSNVTLDSVSGTNIFQQYITRRSYPASTNPAFALGATSFEATFILDRALMDMMRPKDSMLKTDVGVSNNQLRLQLGALSDMFTGVGAGTYGNVSVDTFITDYQEARVNGNTPSPLYYVKRNGQNYPIAGAVNGYQIKLNTGNRLRFASMIVRDSTGEPNLALVTRIRVMRAGDTRADIPVTDLRRLNEASYGVSLATGQVVVDFANTGQLGVRYSEFWPIPSSADTYLLIDTSAQCEIELTTLEGVDLVAAK